jgi:hypothetical protein
MNQALIKNYMGNERAKLNFWYASLNALINFHSTLLSSIIPIPNAKASAAQTIAYSTDDCPCCKRG